MLNVRSVGFALAAMLVATTADAQQKRADLVLIHGDVFTVDSLHPRAQAIAVSGNRIAAVGSDAEIQPWVGPKTRVVDLQGRLAIPGFIDGHGHYTGLGESKLVLDLTKAKSWDDIVAQVRDKAKSSKPGTLIDVTTEKQEGRSVVTAVAKTEVKPGEELADGFVFVESKEIGPATSVPPAL